MSKQKTGLDLIAAERKRQMAMGWSAAHDAEHDCEELAIAAACYALPRAMRIGGRVCNGNIVPVQWPFEDAQWNPKGREIDLVRAGALIAAELDRINSVDSSDADDEWCEMWCARNADQLSQWIGMSQYMFRCNRCHRKECEIKVRWGVDHIGKDAFSLHHGSQGLKIGIYSVQQFVALRDNMCNRVE